MTTRKNSTKGRRSRPGPYTSDFKLRAIKLHLEEGYPIRTLAEELGIGKSTLSKWKRRYLEEGESGLINRWPGAQNSSKPRINPAIKQKAVELKKEDPKRGSRRISDMLRRFHLMKASPETVRKTLKEEGLVEPPKKKPKRNPPKPRFFERSRPNQMWQTDIFCFRLGGRNAYLIGFIDDYSRYITSLGLYRSQTAEHVLETLRRGLAEYGVPKEMLSDNGRQYTNWRGTTRFEAELKKDRIKHIKSQPHHPMTLGKIERFWKSIYTEFLSRVQFDSFEEAQQRLALWVKYYNYKRPHQGIGGLCPADRFFEIQTELRQVLERGIEQNVLEAALRGPPRQPFYMVGRMGDQSVVIRAEKGKVKMLLDGEEPGKDKELIYHVDETENKADRETELYGETEVRSGTGHLERAPASGGGVPGAGDSMAAAQQLAGCGDEGDDERPRLEAGSRRGEAAVTESADGKAAGEGGCGGDAPEPSGSAAGLDPENGGAEEKCGNRELIERVALLSADDAAIVLELLKGCSPPENEEINHELLESDTPRKGGADPQGEGRTDDGRRSCAAAEDQPKDLLQMGATGPGGAAREPLRAEPGASARRLGWGKGGTQAPGSGTGAGAETQGAG